MSGDYSRNTFDPKQLFSRVLMQQGRVALDADWNESCAIIEYLGAKYGPTALAIGTTIKLARALWIVPLSIATAAVLKSKARIQWPWFILFFCLAALLNTLLPEFHTMFAALNHMGKLGLTVTLFLIGTSLTRESLRSVGIRPLVQGLTLWVVVGVSTLTAILMDWIRV